MPAITGGSMNGVVVANSEPVNAPWSKSQLAAATEKASVMMARNRPWTRSAGRPMSRAAPSPTAVATRTATPQGSCRLRSKRSKGTGMSRSWVTMTIVPAPSPTKAN